MGKKKLLSGIMLIIIPSVVLSFGDVNLGEIIWAVSSIILGLFVLKSAWVKSKNKSQLDYAPADIKKAIYGSALLGGILSIIYLLQTDFSMQEKLLAILSSLILIIVIAKIILKISLKRPKRS